VIRISTPELASRIKLSQQTASRHLRELERLGLIERAITSRGEIVRITDRGMDQLQATYFRLRSVVEKEKPRTVLLEGEVVSGLGEGAYYMSLEGYRKQFKAKLGFEPYPGTLNLKLSGTSLNQRKRLSSMDSIIIEGFKNEMRTYGDVKCFSAIIQGRVRGAVVIIDRTHYAPSILEVIAPVKLRREFKLRDGDIIGLQVLTGRTRRGGS